MSDVATEKSMAPKRQRMMDMVLFIGGLKEESAIPPSKVNEEIENLKRGVAPLTESILEFPDAYLTEFTGVAQRTRMVEEIHSPSILTEAIASLESALTKINSESVSGLLVLLKDSLNRTEGTGEAPEVAVDGDIEAILKPLPELISKIDSTIDEYEETAKSNAEAATVELTSLIDTLESLTSDMNSDPDTTLAGFQKLGAKTRYGPFLRTAAQLKRGKREGRINDELFRRLLTANLLTELHRGVIMFILNKMGSRTVPRLGELMKTHPSHIQKIIVSMFERGEVEMVGLDSDSPVFARVTTDTPGTTLVLKQSIQQLRGMLGSLDESLRTSTESILGALDRHLERLVLLGAYDEASLAESLNELRERTDSATEAVLSTPTSDTSEELQLLVSAGLEAFTRFRLKITLEKGPNLVSDTNVYGEKLDPEVYKIMMDSYLDNELERGTMLILIRELGAMSAKDLAEKTKIPQDRVFSHLLRMKRDELLLLAGEEHGYVLYDVPRTLSEAEIATKTVSDLALQLASARVEIESVLGDFKAENIGKLATSLEAFSKARDTLEKVTIKGSVIAESVLKGVEEKVKSAVAMTYRTRAKLPSTRPKVTIEELMDVDVPSVLEEYRSQVGYAPLLGFGTIEWEQSKCLGCKSCEIDCPEDAIELKPVIDVQEFFELSEESMKNLPVNKALFYQTVRSLATKKPVERIRLANEAPGFGTIEVDLWLCVGCRTCVRRCPGPENGALELVLKWNLPEVVKQITSET